MKPKKIEGVPVVPSAQHYEAIRNSELQGLDNILAVLEGLVSPDDDELGLYEENALFRRVIQEVLDANRPDTIAEPDATGFV